MLDAGFAILAALDKDSNAAETYRRNITADVLEEDIRLIDPRIFRKQLCLSRGELDLLAGCPPCQGFSRIRNSTGASDDRNDLVLTYLEFLAEFKPKFALFENVPGLVRSTHGKIYYSSLLRGMAKLGYALEEHLLDAADFGVPQHRKRAIVVGSRQGLRLPIISPTHANPRSKEVRLGQRKPWVTVRQAIGHYPFLRSGELSESIPNHVASRTGQSKKGSRVLDFIRKVPADGGSRHDVAIRDWLPCHKRIDGFKDVYGRLSWESPSNTITGGCTNPSKGRFVHPEQDRGLSYREAAALQSFPDSFVFYGGRIAEQIGNAVPPLLAENLARAFRAADESAGNAALEAIGSSTSAWKQLEIL